MVLLHHLKHNQVLHEQVILLSITAEEVPAIDDVDRVRTETFEHGFFRVTARYGFMETPNVPAVLMLAAAQGLEFKPATTSYYLGQERLLPSGHSHIAALAEKTVRRHGAQCSIGRRIFRVAAKQGGRACYWWTPDRESPCAGQRPRNR